MTPSPAMLDGYRLLLDLARRTGGKPLPRRTAAAVLAVRLRVSMPQAHAHLQGLVQAGLARDVMLPLADESGRWRGAERGVSLAPSAG